jgi:hypothetical protein
MEITKKNRKWKIILLGVWVVICFISFLFFGLNNPTHQESSERLGEMMRDMEVVLKSGGVVDSQYSNAKIGGAVLYVNLDANAWSPELANSYRRSLSGLGWRDLTSDTANVSLCKNGILAKIGLNSSVDNSHGRPMVVYYDSMEYSGNTIKLCN